MLPGSKGNELSQPHGRITRWSRSRVYDTVTSMYLDCLDDAEVARTLSEDLKMDISPHHVAGIRAEAAAAAEHLPPETRKKWLYRYRRLTVNNLVKEFMFIEGTRNFIAAKRTLAREVETLVKTMPPDRLCIAINDAIGRNNIGLEIILRLEAYSRRSDIMDCFVAAYARERYLPDEAAMLEVAGFISRVFNAECQRDYPKAISALKQTLKQEAHPFEPEDVDYFLEYAKLNGEDNNPLAARLTSGADLVSKPKSPIEQVISGASHHLPPNELQQVMSTLRSRKVMQRTDLERILDYAVRRQQDLETMRKIEAEHTLPEVPRQQECTALADLVELVRRHISLTDCSEFFTEKEEKQAKRCDISRSDLQTALDRLNSQSAAEDVEQLAEDMLANRGFDFPIERYMETRFRLPT